MRTSLINTNVIMNKNQMRQPAEDAEDAFQILLETLIAYEDIEKDEDHSNQLKLFKLLRNRMSTVVVQKKDLNMGSASRFFLFYLLNLTHDEFYSCYRKFYRQFDKDDSLRVDKGEFNALLDYLTKSENMGKKKVMKSFECLDKSFYDDHMKTSFMNTENFLEEKFKEVMFNLVCVNLGATDKMKSQQESYVHYLKFFPVMLSYFSEFVRKRVAVRITNLELICGDPDKPPKPNEVSFVAKLISVGVKFKKEKVGDRIEKETYAIVSFKQLEKALIIFRNSFTETFTNEQLSLIIKELKKKLKMYSNDNLEAIFLTGSLIRWVGYRICVHCALYNLAKAHKDSGMALQKAMVLEEYTIWATAYIANRFTKEDVTKGFLKYASKRMNLDTDIDFGNQEEQAALKDLFKSFVRKVFPHISSPSIDNMFTHFTDLIQGNPDNTPILRRLGENIDGLLVDEATEKLKELVTNVHVTLNNDSGMKQLLGRKSLYNIPEERKRKQSMSVSSDDSRNGSGSTPVSAIGSGTAFGSKSPKVPKSRFSLFQAFSPVIAKPKSIADEPQEDGEQLSPSKRWMLNKRNQLLPQDDGLSPASKHETENSYMKLGELKIDQDGEKLAQQNVSAPMIKGLNNIDAMMNIPSNINLDEQTMTKWLNLDRDSAISPIANSINTNAAFHSSTINSPHLDSPASSEAESGRPSGGYGDSSVDYASQAGASQFKQRREEGVVKRPSSFQTRKDSANNIEPLQDDAPKKSRRDARSLDLLTVDSVLNLSNSRSGANFISKKERGSLQTKMEFNENTKRKPDVLKSFFIMESYLEKHFQKMVKQRSSSKIKGDTQGKAGQENNLLNNINENEEAVNTVNLKFSFNPNDLDFRHDTKKQAISTIDISEQSQANKSLAEVLSRKSSIQTIESQANFEEEEEDIDADREQNLDDIVFKKRVSTKGREGTMCGYTPCRMF